MPSLLWLQRGLYFARREVKGQRSERGLALVTSLLVPGPRQTSPQLFSNLTATILYIIGGYRANEGKIGVVALI